MTISIAETEANGFINGSGTGSEPLGLLGYPITTDIDADRAFGTLQYVVSGAPTDIVSPDVMIDLFYSLKAGHRANAKWIVNSGTAQILMQMKNQYDDYLWSESLVVGQPQTFLGKEVIIMEDIPNV